MDRAEREIETVWIRSARKNGHLERRAKVLYMRLGRPGDFYRNELASLALSD